MQKPAIRSILDNDLYKMTMQHAVQELYPDAEVSYQFTDRAPTGLMNENFHRELRNEIERMADLRLSDDEADFLGTLAFLPKQYIETLRNYRYNPNQVITSVNDGRLSLSIHGKWAATILWEVPLMAAISEVYFRLNHDGWNDEDTLRQYVYTATKKKTERLSGLRFTDFGTRRRRSYVTQRRVVQSLIGTNGFQGTSNVHFAHLLGLKPIGTMAHEFIMGVSALESLRHANRHALRAWNDVYKGRLGIALTDTFGTQAFWDDFDPQLARLYDGVRHDSSDPYKFTEDAISHYKKMGIHPPSKTVVFSDGLTTTKCVELDEAFRNRIGVAFGIGTHLTNDIPNSPALKIVIKLRSCNGVQVVKLGEDIEKATGDKDALRVAHYTFFGTPLD